MVKKYIHKAYGWRPFRYLVAGGITFSTDYVVFLVLHYIFNLSSPVGGTISFLFGLVVSFTLQRFWVFKGDSKRLVKKELVAYSVLAVINLAVTAYGLVLLGHIGVPPFIGKLMIILLIMVWNYLLYKNVIFRQQKV